jgi:hypothetical protein
MESETRVVSYKLDLEMVTFGVGDLRQSPATINKNLDLP